MRRALLLLLLAVLGLACPRATLPPGVSAPVDAGGRWPDDPFEPVPPLVKAALAERHENPEAALELLDRAHATALDAGDARSAAIALHRRGDVLAATSGYQAAGCYLRALALYELLGEQRLEAVCCNDLGLVERAEFGDPLPWFRRGVALRRKIGDRAGLRVALLNLGATLALGRSADEAVPLLREAAALAQEFHHREGEWKARADLAAALLRREENALDAASDGGQVFDLAAAGPGLPAWREAFSELAQAYRLARAQGRDPRETACRALPDDLFPLCDAVEATETRDGGALRAAGR